MKGKCAFLIIAYLPIFLSASQWKFDFMKADFSLSLSRCFRFFPCASKIFHITCYCFSAKPDAYNTILGIIIKQILKNNLKTDITHTMMLIKTSSPIVFRIITCILMLVIIPNRSLENLAFTLLEIRCNYGNN